jgi:hypothetical protein
MVPAASGSGSCAPARAACLAGAAPPGARVRCRAARCAAAPRHRTHGDGSHAHQAVQLAASERSAQSAALRAASGDTSSRGARAAARRQRAQRAPDVYTPAFAEPPPLQLLLLDSPELRACALGGGVLALLLLLPPAPADAEGAAAAAVAVPALGDALRAVAAKTFKGGVAGFAAGALQVCAFMWLRTAMNVQVRGARASCAARARHSTVVLRHRRALC